MTTISKFNEKVIAINDIKTRFKNTIKLNMHEIVILDYVYKHKNTQMKNIIKYTQFLQPKCNKAIKHLQSIGYVIKERNKHDERIVSVSLNEEKSKEIENTLNEVEKLITKNIKL